MGDISAEPSMEEILSSIKRIIAEEGDGPPGRRRAARPAPVAAAPALEPEIEPEPDPESEPDDQVLELSEPMPVAAPEPLRDPVAAEPARPSASLAPAAEPAPAVDPILSPAAADATRGALESLSRLRVKAEPVGDGTLEGLVREMLRPMLRDWLDAHLPDLVEAMVAKEIARISGQGR